MHTFYLRVTFTKQLFIEWQVSIDYSNLEEALQNMKSKIFAYFINPLLKQTFYFFKELL